MIYVGWTVIGLVGVCILAVAWMVWKDEFTWGPVRRIKSVSEPCAICSEVDVPGGREDCLEGRPKVCVVCRGRALGLAQAMLRRDIREHNRKVKEYWQSRPEWSKE